MKTKLINAKVHGPATNADYMRRDFARGEYGYVMSRSELKNFAACPARWLHGYQEEGSAEQSWGDLVDCVALTPNDFPKRFALTPATYPAPESAKKGAPMVEKPWNWNATFCKEYKARLNGKTPVKDEGPEGYREAKIAAAALLADDSIRTLFEASSRQILVTADYEDADTGLFIPLKGLVDLAPNANDENPFIDCLADLKTCNTAHPEAWARQVHKFGYDMQAALYLDLWNAATGEKRNEFRHVLQENYPPYQIGRRLLSDEFLSLGRHRYQSALRLYCQCLATSHWPDYEHGRNGIDGWTFADPEPWMILSSPASPDPDWVKEPTPA